MSANLQKTDHSNETLQLTFYTCNICLEELNMDQKTALYCRNNKPHAFCTECIDSHKTTTFCEVAKYPFQGEVLCPTKCGHSFEGVFPKPTNIVQSGSTGNHALFYDTFFSTETTYDELISNVPPIPEGFLTAAQVPIQDLESRHVNPSSSESLASLNSETSPPRSTESIQIDGENQNPEGLTYRSPEAGISLLPESDNALWGVATELVQRALNRNASSGSSSSSYRENQAQMMLDHSTRLGRSYPTDLVTRTNTDDRVQAAARRIFQNNSHNQT